MNNFIIKFIYTKNEKLLIEKCMYEDYEINRNESFRKEI